MISSGLDRDQQVRNTISRISSRLHKQSTENTLQVAQEDIKRRKKESKSKKHDNEVNQELDRAKRVHESEVRKVHEYERSNMRQKDDFWLRYRAMAKEQDTRYGILGTLSSDALRSEYGFSPKPNSNNSNKNDPTRCGLSPLHHNATASSYPPSTAAEEGMMMRDLPSSSFDGTLHYTDPNSILDRSKVVMVQQSSSSEIRRRNGTTADNSANNTTIPYQVSPATRRRLKQMEEESSRIIHHRQESSSSRLGGGESSGSHTKGTSDKAEQDPAAKTISCNGIETINATPSLVASVSGTLEGFLTPSEGAVRAERILETLRHSGRNSTRSPHLHHQEDTSELNRRVKNVGSPNQISTLRDRTNDLSSSDETLIKKRAPTSPSAPTFVSKVRNGLLSEETEEVPHAAKPIRLAELSQISNISFIQDSSFPLPQALTSTEKSPVVADAFQYRPQQQQQQQQQFFPSPVRTSSPSSSRAGSSQPPSRADSSSSFYASPSSSLSALSGATTKTDLDLDDDRILLKAEIEEDIRRQDQKEKKQKEINRSLKEKKSSSKRRSRESTNKQGPISGGSTSRNSSVDSNRSEKRVTFSERDTVL